MENNSQWYIVNVMAGQESKVVSDIKAAIIRNGVNQHVVDIFVPTKKIVKIKKGQKLQENQKIFPGYIFINTDLQGGIYNIVNSIPKVMGFLGSKNNPKPVAESKMREILDISSQDTDDKGIIFEVGEILNVIEGPFESFSGAVENFDPEKQKIKISILIFGRATSVELNFDQVEKAA